MPFFVDTSALFKRYQIEKGSDKVTALLEKERGNVFISSLTIIEVVSNLKRLCEIDHITTKEQFLQQRLFFYHDIDELAVTILDVTTDDIIKAEEIILKRYMKPVDAIQVAVALNNFTDKPTFISSDQRLCIIAQQEGLSTLNPES
jgi:predicted nucleic acid-binding protein